MDPAATPASDGICRLLERLYLADEGWIVKGAAALLARDLGVRATIDIDVFRNIARETASASCATQRAKISVTGSASRLVHRRRCETALPGRASP